MPTAAIAPMIGLAGSLIGGSKKSAPQQQAQQQQQVVQQSSAAQDAINEIVRQILNEQLTLYGNQYKPLEVATTEGYGRMAPYLFSSGELWDSLAAMTNQLANEFTAPYQLPPQIRQKMLEGMQSQEQRSLSDTTGKLRTMGIEGAPLAKAVTDIHETFLPQRYGLERDLAIQAADRQDTRKLQGQGLLGNFVQQYMDRIAQAGQSGRTIPGYATGILAQLAGQYANAAAMANQPNPYAAMQNAQQGQLWNSLGTIGANLFSGNKSPASGGFNPIGNSIGSSNPFAIMSGVPYTQT